MNRSSAVRTLTIVGATASIGATLIVTLVAGVIGPAVSQAGTYHLARTSQARTARTLNATDTAHLRYIRSSGSLLIEEGAASGTLPGTMHARASIGPSLRASFTIYTHGGTIDGQGTATPHGSGRYESFAGSLVVTGGSGHYAHAHGHAGFYGTFDRRTYALTVQTTGNLSY